MSLIPLVLRLSLGVVSSKSKPFLLFYCVIDGLFPGAFPCVLQPPLLLFLSFGVASSH
jgi:hypothetical protein